MDSFIDLCSENSQVPRRICRNDGTCRKIGAIVDEEQLAAENFPDEFSADQLATRAGQTKTLRPYINISLFYCFLSGRIQRLCYLRFVTCRMLKKTVQQGRTENLPTPYTSL